MKEITGGICAPKGFTAAGVHCGIRKNPGKKDLSLIMSEAPCTAAAVYTTNLVKGAPIIVDKEHLKNGVAQAIICNSGIANTCNANGVEVANAMADLVEKYAGIKADDVVVASTGVIGEPLNLEPIEAGLPGLVKALSADGSLDACHGIMTTDTVEKQVAVEFEIGGVQCRIGGIAKGSGMIHPNMATMLVFITSDVKISAAMLQKALSADIKNTFNMLSVDGDTSTNDTVAVLANGLAGNAEITEDGEEFAEFMKALNSVNVALSRKIAADGEGATKLLECKVSGAASEEIAKVSAKSVITSSLVKSAFFGEDANWGRVLCALGYSGADLDPDTIDLTFSSAAGSVLVCKNGAGVEFSEELAAKVLHEDEILIDVCVGNGPFEATAWGCDLTYEYVKINGEYRT
ncbi:MAG: bifunctional glutamate N-acetyltransferase/amino-acid acetyltransferase ArgJ [Clostridia bacterium]|nr:bifunctional glutamate N-acetyltransferase/amino-acid acetyltransferase ArgJ [Clostridia bacterium]